MDNLSVDIISLVKMSSSDTSHPYVKLNLPEEINQESKLDTTGPEPTAQANDNQEPEVKTLEPSSTGGGLSYPLLMLIKACVTHYGKHWTQVNP